MSCICKPNDPCDYHLATCIVCSPRCVGHPDSGPTLRERLSERAYKASQGNWYPANGGTETPFHTRNRRRLLYCWQPSTGRHAYLDLDTDLILSDSDAQIALGT